MRALKILLITACGLLSCQEGEKKKSMKEENVNMPIKYGAEYNSTRIELGITTVPQDYIPIQQTDGINWAPPNHDFYYYNKIPHHSKFIRYDENKIIEEWDTFYSNCEYDQPDSDVPRKFKKAYMILEIIYTYLPYEGREKGWTCLLEGKGYPLKNKLTIEQADSVLASWGFNRLYPDQKTK